MTTRSGSWTGRAGGVTSELSDAARDVSLDGGELAAAQTALAAEHAAIYGYAVVGAHLSGSERATAVSAYQDHRRRRDELIRLITAAQATPTPAAAAYRLPFAVDSADEARELAARLEDGIAQAYAALVAAAGGKDMRGLGASALADAAVAAAGWRGSTPPFPGLRTPPASGD
jgi:hypothetical protein